MQTFEEINDGDETFLTQQALWDLHSLDDEAVDLVAQAFDFVPKPPIPSPKNTRWVTHIEPWPRWSTRRQQKPPCKKPLKSVQRLPKKPKSGDPDPLRALPSHYKKGHNNRVWAKIGLYTPGVPVVDNVPCWSCGNSWIAQWKQGRVYYQYATRPRLLHQQITDAILRNGFSRHGIGTYDKLCKNGDMIRIQTLNYIHKWDLIWVAVRRETPP